MSRLFDHEGCHSGQCIWQEHGMACLISRELGDPKNHDAERRHSDDLLNEAGRLLEDAGRMGVAPRPLKPPKPILTSDIKPGDRVRLHFQDDPTGQDTEGVVLDVNDNYVGLQQGGGYIGKCVDRIEKLEG